MLTDAEELSKKSVTLRVSAVVSYRIQQTELCVNTRFIISLQSFAEAVQVARICEGMENSQRR